MRIGPQELIIVLIIVLVIFGPKNLPKLGKMFGKTMKNFKEGMEDVDENGDVAAEYGIRNIPTVLFFKNGELVDKQVGSAPKSAYVAKIEAIL